MRIKDLMDVVFPRRCACCDSPVGDEAGYICWDCVFRLPVIRPPFCSICGYPPCGTVDGVFVCRTCVNEQPSFDLARSALLYTKHIKPLLHAFKYHNSMWLAGDLVSLILASFKTHMSCFRVDSVIAVPLHSARRRERSYNQARLLALGIAGILRKPVCEIYRKRRTKSQTHLTASRRKANVEGAFSVGNGSRLEGLNILLVDDVMTTGATLNECAKALKSAGARTVAALTVARG